MISVIVFYIVLLLGSGLFYILYKGVISFYLFLFIIILPIFSLICMLISRKMIHISLSSPSEGKKGGKFPIIVNISNSSLCSFPILKIKLEYYNSQIKVPKAFYVSTSISAKSNFQLKLELSSDYTGIVDVRIKKVTLYDFMGLFFCFLPKKNYPDSANRSRIGIFPEIITLNAELSSVKSVDYESDFFSKTQKGDDPSEIFDMHDYQPGDKLNKIHWKLSAKLDNLFVKDYSLPVSSSVYIFYNNFLGKSPTEDDIRKNDALLTVLFSLSFYLCENELSHKVIYTNESGDFSEIKIEETSDLYTAFFEMIAPTEVTSERMLVENYLYENQISPFSRILFFSLDGSEFISAADELFADCRITVFSADSMTQVQSEKQDVSTLSDYQNNNYSDMIKINPENIAGSIEYIDI